MLRRFPRAALALVVCLVPLTRPAAEPAPALFRTVPASGLATGSPAGARVEFDAGLLLAVAPRLRLDLPGGRALAAVRRESRRRGPASALWQGTIPGAGGAVLTLHRGLLAGMIHAPHGDFEVVPLGPGEAALERLPSIPRLACAPAPSDLPSSPGTSALPDAAASTAVGADGDRVDVLVLYTPQAMERAGGRRRILARIRSRIDYANAAFAASDMSMRIELVRTARAPFDDHPTISTMVAVRRSPLVAAMRDAARADLVAVVTDSFECGQAELLTLLGGGTDHLAHSVAAIWCGGAQIFTHEIGHNLGFRHDPEYDGHAGASVRPWSWAHWSSGRFRTLMAGTFCQNCSSISRFSNPDVAWEGVPIGVPDERDNARASRETAPQVAAYRRSGRLLVDDFESGGTGAWDRSRGGLETVRPGLRFSEFALGVPLDPGRPRYLAHAATGAEAGVDVELLLRLDGARIGAGEVEILRLVWEGRAHTTLTLQGAAGDVLALHTRGNDGDPVQVAQTPLRGRGVQRVGLRWRRASPGGRDGSVRLLLSGRDRGGADGLASDRLGVGQVRVGLPAGVSSPGAGGALRIDDYRAVADPLPAPGGNRG